MKRKNAYNSHPTADLIGNAGNLGPGEREIRYPSYIEKQHLATDCGANPVLPMEGQGE